MPQRWRDKKQCVKNVIIFGGIGRNMEILTNNVQDVAKDVSVLIMPVLDGIIFLIRLEGKQL